MEHLQHYRDEIVLLVADHLVKTRQQETLASLCALSKKYYHLLHQRLYQRFYLNNQSARFLLHIILELYQSKTNRKAFLMDSLRKCFTGLEPGARMPFKPYTPVMQRASLVKEFYVDTRLDEGMYLAVRTLSGAEGPLLAPPTALPLGNVRLLVLKETCWGPSPTDWDWMTGITSPLATIMQPESICMTLPAPIKSRRGSESGRVEWFEDGVSDISFTDSMAWLQSHRLETFSPLRSIRVHSPRHCRPPLINHDKTSPPVDVYLPPVQKLSEPTGNSFHEAIRKRNRQLYDFACKMGSFDSAYRFHGLLDDHDIAALSQSGDIKIADIESLPVNQLIKKYWTDGVDQHFRTEYPSGKKRNRSIPFSLPEYKALLDQKFEFCPAPPAEARCANCHVLLRGSRTEDSLRFFSGD